MAQSSQSLSDKSSESLEASPEGRRRSVTFGDDTSNGGNPLDKNSPSQSPLSTNGDISLEQSADRAFSKGAPTTSPQDTLGRSIRDELVEPLNKNLEPFLPRDKLDEILTKERIIHALDREGGFPVERLDAIAEKIINPSVSILSSQPHLQSRKEILATLSLINKVPTIESFIEDGLYDYDLPFSYVREQDSPRGDGRRWVMKTSDLERESRVIPLFYQWSDNAAESFEGRQWKIHVPVFTNVQQTIEKPTHYVLAQKAILPYISKDEVGRGGYSAVDKVVIDARHVDPSENSSQKTVFAVKKLETSKKCVFDREVSNLNRFARKHAPHLIQLLWTFSLGSVYHLVFPFADGNLMDFWIIHDSPLVPRGDHKDALWFARQCLGIVEGLNMIHQGSEHDPLELQKHGRHGDLKPENILWFRNLNGPGPGYSLGTLKISDFGLTRFHRTETKSHVKTDGIGWSPTYRAPEYDVLNEVAQSYDIWCLGCVLLEFAIWYLKGWKAVDEFSQSRKSEDKNPRMREDTFFNHVQKANMISAVAKRSVAHEVRSLYEHGDTSDFLIDFVQLLETGLLRMHPEIRMKCCDTVKQLQGFYEKCERSSDYCFKMSKQLPPRRNTDLSDLDALEQPLASQQRGSASSSPRLPAASFRISGTRVDTVFEGKSTEPEALVRGTPAVNTTQPGRFSVELGGMLPMEIPGPVDGSNQSSGIGEVSTRSVDLMTAERTDQESNDQGPDVREGDDHGGISLTRPNQHSRAGHQLDPNPTSHSLRRWDKVKGIYSLICCLK